MREAAVYRFLELLGCDRSRMQKSRGWINTFCPLAPYTHSSGIDSRPSFGVSISDEQRSVYFCFGCSPQPQRLEQLLHTIFVLSESYPTEAAEVFGSEENHFAAATEEQRKSFFPDLWTGKRRKIVAPLPPAVLRSFPPLQFAEDLAANSCKMYLEDKRKIPQWVYHYFGVRYDPKRVAVVFPMTDPLGRIFVLRERAIEKKEMWTVNKQVSGVDINYPKLRDVGAWFGLHLVTVSEPLILVEGELDAMRLVALGKHNAIASAATSVTDAQINMLSAPIIYLGYDSDKAGASANDKILAKLRKPHVSVFALDWSVAGRKDAGDLEDARELEEIMRKRRVMRVS